MTNGQFGHAKDQVVNDLRYQVFVASLGFTPSDRFTIHGDFTLTLNEAAFDPIAWSGIDPRAFASLVASGQWDYNFAGVEDLSNLDIRTIEVGLGAEYQLLEQATLNAVLSWAQWDDRQWVYNDNSGDYLSASLGLAIAF